MEYKIQYYLLTPKNYLRLLSTQAARKYFSKPVRVEPQFSTLGDRLLWVKDLNTGKYFPINKANLRNQFQLSKRQIKLADNPQ